MKNFLNIGIRTLIVFHCFCVYSNGKVDSLIHLSRMDSVQMNSDRLYLLCKQISFISNDLDVKMTYAEYAYSIALNEDDNLKMASSSLLLAKVYKLKGNLILALISLDKAQRLYELIGNKKAVADCLIRKAGIYKRNNEFAKSETTYLVAIHNLLNLDSLRYAAAICNLGELYRELGKPQKALLYLQKADSLFNQFDYRTTVAYTKGNIGLVYIDLNKPDSAKINLHKAIAILEPTGDNYAVSAYLEGLARLAIADGDLAKAEQLGLKSLRLANEYGLKEQIRDASLCLSGIYSANKTYKAAYQYHCNYVIYRDSFVNENTKHEIANLRTKYEVAQKQKEVNTPRNRR